MYPKELLLLDDDNDEEDKLQFCLLRPEEVLVRICMEHSRFTTLNHQQFGAKFVGKVVSVMIIQLIVVELDLPPFFVPHGARLPFIHFFEFFRPIRCVGNL